MKHQHTKWTCKQSSKIGKTKTNKLHNYKEDNLISAADAVVYKCGDRVETVDLFPLQQHN